MRDRWLHITSYYSSCFVHAESNADAFPGYFHISRNTDDEYTSPLRSLIEAGGRRPA